MASNKVLVKTTTGPQVMQDGDTALVGSGIKSDTGQSLTVTADTGNIIHASNTQFASGVGISSAGGAAAFDLSGSTGTFLTPTGTTTLSGNTTLASAKTLDATAGTAKLPLQFFVNTIQTSTNVTGTNLNTLVAGSSSNADTLHTHSAISATALVATGLTLWATPTAGQVGYMTGTDNTAAKAIATAMSTSRVLGAYAGTASTLTCGGSVSLFFDSGLTALTSGARVFLSDVNAGQVTITEPSTVGHVSAELGILLVGTGYNNSTGSAQSVLWQPKQPIQL